MFRGTLRSLATTCLAVVSLVIVAAPSATASATGRPAGRAHPPAPIALGVNIANAPDETQVLDSYVNLVHRAPAMVMWYQQWSEPLYYPDQMAHIGALGTVPVITWDPLENGVGIPLSRIVSGRYDTYIRASAVSARAFRSLIYIRFGHEMNLSGSGFGPGDSRGDTPQEYVRAWRHVVRIFRRAGATNVEWVWSPNVDCGGKCPFTSYYPGNRWVDWVALDGYNYSTVDHTPWQTFNQIFGPSYRVLTRLTRDSKPVMVGEMASAGAGGSKAAWISQAFSAIPRRFRRIHAVIWFDRDKETNWTVNSSRPTLLAWDGVVHSHTYAGTPSTLSGLLPTRDDVTSRGVSVRRQTRRAA